MAILDKFLLFEHASPNRGSLKSELYKQNFNLEIREILLASTALCKIMIYRNFLQVRLQKIQPISSNSNGNYLPSGFLVGHGKCTRDSMRPAIWCEAAPHFGGLHATLMLGYPHYDVCLPAAHLLVCDPPPSFTKPGQEDLHACWKIFIVLDLPALRIRIQFSDTKALAVQSKIMTMGIVSAVAMGFHIFLSWLPMVHFKSGLMGVGEDNKICDFKA